MDDGTLIVTLFDKLEEAYILLDEAQSDAPLHSGARRQWFEDRGEWIESVKSLSTTYLEGWTPPR